MRFELTTPTLARLCSTPELRPPMFTGADRTASAPDHTATGWLCKMQLRLSQAILKTRLERVSARAWARVSYRYRLE